MKFRPLHDRVVVRRIDADEKTVGGIIIPIRQRRNLNKVRSSPSARAAATRKASSCPSTSRRVISCCSANGPAPRSRSTARSC
jgi:hypothetical protein